MANSGTSRICMGISALVTALTLLGGCGSAVGGGGSGGSVDAGDTAAVFNQGKKADASSDTDSADAVATGDGLDAIGDVQAPQDLVNLKDLLLDTESPPDDVAVGSGADTEPDTAPPQETAPCPTGVALAAGVETAIAKIHATSKANCSETKIVDTLKTIVVKSAIVTSFVDKSTSSAGKKYAGVFVQSEGGGANSGLYLSALQGGPIDCLKIGDVISISGSVAEFYCSTQLTPTVVKFEDTATPTPVSIDLSKIGEKATLADNRSFENALVTLNNVYVSDTAPLGSDGKPHGDIYIGSSASDSAVLVHSAFGFFLTNKNADGTYASKWPKGTKFSSITGVMQYSFGKFALLPMGEKAIVVAL